MTQIIRRGAALLLTLALFISLFPAAMAAETEETASPLVSDKAVLETQVEMQTTEPEITEPPTESPPGETIPEETTAPDTEPTVPSETMPEDSSEMDIPMNLPEDADMLSVGSTQGSIMLFDYAGNGNYTTVLNSQVSCTYKPNGSGTTRTAYIKNLGWHFARYGGVAYPDDPLYCIEPWRNYGASTSGNTVDQDVTLSGSGSTSGSNVWYAMPTARREAIGLILLYSDQMWDHSVSVTTTRKDSNPNVPLRIATQFLIYEIVCGLRDPSTFERNYENECGTSGDVFYNAVKASVSGFSSNYNTLVSNILAAKKIPSFTSSSMGNAPTITLKRRIQNQFHAYCVTVLKNEARRIQREYTRRRELEKSLEDLTPSEQEQTAVADRYFTDEHVFEVQGLPVVVTGDLLADALAKLPEGKRNVILLSYFLDLNDREIGEKLNLLRQTVSKRRLTTLKELHDYLIKEGFEWPDR